MSASIPTLVTGLVAEVARINQTQDRLATEFTALDLRLQEIERMLRTAAEPRPRRRPKKADA